MGWEVAMTTMENNTKVKGGDGVVGLLMSFCMWRENMENQGTLYH